MAFSRKAAVGTALDKEEMEEFLKRGEALVSDLKTAIFEMNQALKKAGAAAEALNKASARAELAARKPLKR